MGGSWYSCGQRSPRRVSARLFHGSSRTGLAWHREGGEAPASHAASHATRLKQRRRETGEIAPRAQRYGPRPVLAPHLAPHLATLAALIHEQPDRTLADLQAALPTPASLATIWRAVTKLGFTLEKNGAHLMDQKS